MIKKPGTPEALLEAIGAPERTPQPRHVVEVIPAEASVSLGVRITSEHVDWFERNRRLLEDESRVERR